MPCNLQIRGRRVFLIFTFILGLLYNHLSAKNSLYVAYKSEIIGIITNFTVNYFSLIGLSYRFLHTTPILEKKSSSKIEDTVTRLKERQNEALAEFSKVEDLEKKIASVIEAEDLVSFHYCFAIEFELVFILMLFRKNWR